MKDQKLFIFYIMLIIFNIGLIEKKYVIFYREEKWSYKSIDTLKNDRYKT